VVLVVEEAAVVLLLLVVVVVVDMVLWMRGEDAVMSWCLAESLLTRG
jgi:hypothetical protein